MSFSKYNMAHASLENAEFENQIKDHTTFGDLIIPKPKFQTKICDHWRRFGVCSYGDSCWYAHGESDLRKLSLKAEKFDDKMSEFNSEVPKIAPKRTSTNVKGLTVSIPSSSFKEPNLSLPLSPAQERWVSMSGQGLKSTEPFELEHDKKMMLENVAEKRFGRGGEEEHEFEELGYLTSPTLHYHPPPFANRVAHGAHRSFSRGARLAQNPAQAQYPAQPQYPATAPARTHFPPSHRSSSALRSSRESSYPSWREPEPKSDEQQFLAELAKAKDMAHMRFMMEQGLISDRQNDLMSNPPSFNQAPPKNGSDCHGCGGSTTRGKEHVSLYSSFIQRPQQRSSHHHHSQHFAPPHFRAAHPWTQAPPAELAAPPKMLESLLPSDGAFSIWVDSKSARAPSQAQFTESSDSTTSLLTKMEALRSEMYPMTEEDISSASGKSPVNGNLSSIESLSPLEMMGSKMTMFDFDSLKIAETLRMTPATSRSAMTDSPFFSIDDRTPGFAESPSPFMEPCDFFSAGGSCPFGDGCHLSHSIRNEHN